MASVYKRTPRNVRSVYARPSQKQTDDTSTPAEDKQASQNGTRQNKNPARLKTSRKSTIVGRVYSNQPKKCITDSSHQTSGWENKDEQKKSASGRLGKEKSLLSRKPKEAEGLVSNIAARKELSEAGKPIKAEDSELASSRENSQGSASGPSRKSRAAEGGKPATTRESYNKKELLATAKSKTGKSIAASSSLSELLNDNIKAPEGITKRGLDVGDRSITQRKPFVCATCQKRYTTEIQLREHERVHLTADLDVATSQRAGQSPPFQCDVCHKFYGSERWLRKHRTVHSAEKNLICEVCGKSFSQAGTLRLHMLEHSGERPFACDVCEKTYRRNFDLQQHKRLHTGERPYACKICGKAFTKMDYLKTHMQCHNGVRPFKCDECSQSFRRTEQLKAHRILHTGVKLFQCEICKKTFSTKKMLKKHMESRVHKVKRDPVSSKVPVVKVCEVCGMQLGKNKSMKAHMMTHTGERPYVCEMCNKGFIIKYDWLVHMRKHTGEKPFVCSICSASYPRNADLNQHIRIVHWGRKPHICDTCGETFARRQHLKKHRVTHTNTVPHTCSECGKGFIEAAALKSHVRTHTGEKPFACMLCSRCFSDAGSRRRHMRIHTGEKPYQCMLCCAAFARPEPYKQHFDFVHGSVDGVVRRALAVDQSVLPAHTSALSVVVSSVEGFYTTQPSGTASVFMAKPDKGLDSTASEGINVFNTAPSVLLVQAEDGDSTISMGGALMSVEDVDDAAASSVSQGEEKEGSVYTLVTDVVYQPLPSSNSHGQSEELECSGQDPQQDTESQLIPETSSGAAAEFQEELASSIIEVQVTRGGTGKPPRVIEVIYDRSLIHRLPTVYTDLCPVGSPHRHEVDFPTSPSQEVEVDTVQGEDVMIQVDCANSKTMVEEVKVGHGGNETGMTLVAAAESPVGPQCVESEPCGASSAVSNALRYCTASGQAQCVPVPDSQGSSYDLTDAARSRGSECQVTSEDAGHTADHASAETALEPQTDSHPLVKYFQVYHADGTESVKIIDTQAAVGDSSDKVLQQLAVGHGERTSSPGIIRVQAGDTIHIIAAEPVTCATAAGDGDTAADSLLESSDQQQKFLLNVALNIHTDTLATESDKPAAVNPDASVFGDVIKARKRIFGKGKRNWICEICGKSFTRCTSLKKHTTVQHQVGGGQAFVCEVCSKVCISKSELAAHTRKHTGERPFACQVCPNTYKHRADLRQHVITFHMGHKPHTCDICHKTFTSGRGLKDHKLIHQGIKSHRCSTCGKAFTQLSTLTTHMLGTHSELRPWVCQYCDKDFTDQSSLARHHRLHTGEKPYSCRHCSSNFTRSEQLKKHLSREHSGGMQNLTTLAEAATTIS